MALVVLGMGTDPKASSPQLQACRLTIQPDVVHYQARPLPRLFDGAVVEVLPCHLCMFALLLAKLLV